MTDLRGQLQAIHDRHGELTPRLVVDEAKPKNHPLHPLVFDRSRKDAADAWYLHRAETLIRSVTIRRTLPNGERTDIRAFSPVRPDRPGVFDPFDQIVEDPVAFAVLLQTMEREWKAMKQRYDHLAQFWQMIQEDVA